MDNSIDFDDLGIMKSDWVLLLDQPKGELNVTGVDQGKIGLERGCGINNDQLRIK